MRDLKNYIISIFDEIKSKKVKFFLYVVFLIFPIMECPYFKHKGIPLTITKYPKHTIFSQKSINNNGNFVSGISNNRKEEESKLQEHIISSKVTLEESFFPTIIFSEQMLKQAYALCQIAILYRQNGELDKAIQLLDQAYSVILGINTHENVSLIKQKDEMRLMISRRILEIYACREIVKRGNQSEIPTPINKQVRYEINYFTKGNAKSYFVDSYKRSGKYRKMIVDMLKKEHLPTELSWLPLIESGFRIKALSKSGALGLWQFIPSTGYKFGLSRDRYIDERLDPEKSTRAAVGYLKELHNHFGDWCTALAAYNCGESEVLRVIRKQKVYYLDSFWDLYMHLPKETARYVPKFLATLYIVKNIEKYGLDKIKVDSPLKFESITVTKKNHLKDIAEITRIESKILEELNPELRQNIVPDGKYELKIPKGHRQRLLANLDLILVLNPSGVDFLEHQVQSGESLYRIARRYRTCVENIMLANNLQSLNHIVIGKTLKIPQKVNPEQCNIVKLISPNSF